MVLGDVETSTGGLSRSRVVVFLIMNGFGRLSSEVQNDEVRMVSKRLLARGFSDGCQSTPTRTECGIGEVVV